MDNTSPPQILVPANHCPAGSRARQRALELALSLNARLTLLAVSPPLPRWEAKSDLAAMSLLHDVLRSPATPSCLPSATTSIDRVRGQALQRLAREVHPDWRGMIDVQLAWRAGDELEQILQHAQEEQADAIVVRVGRASWPRLRPSLADRLLQLAPCEVILVSDARPAPPGRILQWLHRWWPSHRSLGTLENAALGAASYR